MKKIVLILAFLFFPISVNAYYEVTNPNCTIYLRNELRLKAFEIIYSNEKYLDNGVVYFRLLVNNIPSELSVKDLETNIVYNDHFVVNKVLPGSIKNFQIYANSNTECNGYNAYTKIVSIPYYNKYSENILCEGYEDYVLCKESSRVNLSLEAFENAMNEYIESIKEVEEKPNDNIIEEKESFIDVFLNFIYDNYITILVSIIIVGTIGIVIILLIKRKKYNF